MSGLHPRLAGSPGRDAVLDVIAVIEAAVRNDTEAVRILLRHADRALGEAAVFLLASAVVAAEDGLAPCPCTFRGWAMERTGVML